MLPWRANAQKCLEKEQSFSLDVMDASAPSCAAVVIIKTRCFPAWRTMAACLFCSSGWSLCRKKTLSCFGSRSYLGKCLYNPRG
ncbi:hypothetical protein AV530_011813 [Patagioenas fasciata monilis]|uniref:Uncharacterized protein n=1 Tax=Patagioenas fasciata monilis TaxID=372326 RepID=A0A1V4KLS7_PATFA|nr:hypothetical protein AV530_011813 [Patagioenas fasciata monilis]